MMNPPSLFLRTASLALLLSLPCLRAADTSALPTDAEREAMARQTEQLLQRSAELDARSAEAVQRAKALHAQASSAIAERHAQEESSLRETAAKWAAALQLGDAGKESRVTALISTHLGAVRAWHNSHSGSVVPELDEASGKKRSSLDRQFIADSAMPKTAHAVLMEGLRAELVPAQVEAILDSYTEGKVAFTLKGYKAIVADLTPAEEAIIIGHLKTAREEAIDYKGSKLISKVFEIYKTKCEQYLDSNGRSWKQLYKTYTDAVKARKASDKAAH